jgi:hypothetical protein
VTSVRKQRTRVQRMQLARCRLRVCVFEADFLDRIPAVGREFGSPDFERLMEEDYRLGQGVFDPSVRQGHTGSDETFHLCRSPGWRTPAE